MFTQVFPLTADQNTKQCCRLIKPSHRASVLALRLASAAVAASQDSGRVSGPEPTLAVAHALYYGHGVPPSPQAAATQYRLAIKAPGQRHIPAYAFPVLQAKLALGYMHQFGTGVPQDLHLAKRHYDAALGESGSAWLPARFALVILSAHRTWRDMASSNPVLRGLEQPVMDALSWCLHHLRRLCDPVYAFHAPTIPHVAYVPGALEPSDPGAALYGEGQESGRTEPVSPKDEQAQSSKRDAPEQPESVEEDSFWLDDIISEFWDSVMARLDAGALPHVRIDAFQLY